MQFPLSLSFKIVAIAPQVRVTDATGQLIAYVRQKAFKLREDITIFEDEGQQIPLFRIQADRVIDWGARYTITTPAGETVGALQREGGRSLWKATYNLDDASGMRVGLIHEENGWIRVADGLFQAIPYAGILSGFLFQPAYLIDLNGETALYMKKERAFFEGKFTIEQRQELKREDVPLLLASTILTVMMERDRG